LSLAEVEEGNDSRLLVLRWVVRDNFLRAFKVFGCELERNLEEGVRRQEKNGDMIYDDTAGLLWGLSLCCNDDNGVSNEAYEDGALYGPQRARRSAEVRKWRGSVLEQLYAPPKRAVPASQPQA
jgi:hypothetical protein